MIFQPTEKKTRSSVPVSLQTELQAFSRDQLSRTIDSLVARHPQLEMVRKSDNDQASSVISVVCIKPRVAVAYLFAVIVSPQAWAVCSQCSFTAEVIVNDEVDVHLTVQVHCRRPVTARPWRCIHKAL